MPALWALIRPGRIGGLALTGQSKRILGVLPLSESPFFRGGGNTKFDIAAHQVGNRPRIRQSGQHRPNPPLRRAGAASSPFRGLRHRQHLGNLLPQHRIVDLPGCPRPLQNQIDAARTLRIPLVGLHRRADFLALHAHRRPVELSCAGGKIATFADWQILSAHLGAGFDGGTLRSPACSEPLACPSSHPDGWTRPAGTEADPRGVGRTGGIPDQAFPHSPHPKRTSAQDGRLASMLQS
jgi:hypothetical protein